MKLEDDETMDKSSRDKRSKDKVDGKTRKAKQAQMVLTLVKAPQVIDHIYVLSLFASFEVKFEKEAWK